MADDINLEDIYKKKTGHAPKRYVDSVEFCGPILYDEEYVEEEYTIWLQDIIIKNISLEEIQGALDGLHTSKTTFW